MSPQPARALHRSATARGARRGEAPSPPRALRTVPAAPTGGHTGFVALCLALLVGGLVAVLLLNTAIAKDSFEVNALQARSNELSDAEDALGHAIDAQSAPAELARRALQRGMVPSRSASFLRLSDGAVLGVAEPAKKDSGFSVVAQGSSSTRGADGQRTTSITTSGTTTTTTVRVVRGDTVETTVTSVDRASGHTTTRTTTTRAASDPAGPQRRDDEAATDRKADDTQTTTARPGSPTGDTARDTAQDPAGEPTGETTTPSTDPTDSTPSR